MKKKCSKCGKKFPATLEYYHRDSSAPSGLNHRCKKCSIKHALSFQKNGTYNSYRAARERCTNPRHVSYASYGGRGVEFRFNNWRELEYCIGPRPEGKSLDRIDTNGHYEPGNVRWASRKEQGQNTRGNVVTKEEVECIRRLASLGWTYNMLALRYNVSYNTVGLIVRKETWNDE